MSKLPRSITRKLSIDNVFAQIECPINFYRVPKFIFDPGNSNENSITIDLFQNFCEMLSKVDRNTPIILIMVFGMYQIGKSTFLKAITGNGAFKMGNGSCTTTKGIIMDGPYISYLKNRLPDDIINELKNKMQIQPFFH